MKPPVKDKTHIKFLTLAQAIESPVKKPAMCEEKVSFMHWASYIKINFNILEGTFVQIS